MAGFRNPTGDLCDWQMMFMYTGTNPAELVIFNWLVNDFSVLRIHSVE
jgi:hypothetical protein